MFENERLQARINQLFERIETQLRQILRERHIREGKGYQIDESILASVLLAQVEGSLNRFVRSDFKYQPTQYFDQLFLKKSNDSVKNEPLPKIQSNLPKQQSTLPENTINPS